MKLIAEKVKAVFAQKYSRNSKLLVIFTALSFTSLLTSAQSIPLTLVAKDSRTGMQINPNFEAKSMKVDLDLKVTKVNNYMVVKVQSGDKVIIKAQLDGYYPDEKIYSINEDFDSEGRNVVFELDPQPAAALSFKVVDKVNGKKIDAVISFISEGKLIKKISSADATGFSNILLTLPGKYTIKTEAEGYESDSYEETISVNDPPTKYDKAIGLEKQKNILTLRIEDGFDKKPIQDVKLRVTTKDGDVLKNSRTTSEQTEINLKGSGEITIEAEAAGYQRYFETIPVNTDKITLELEREPTIKIDVLNGFNKARISAIVVITSPNGKNTTIKTSENESYEFILKEKGSYKYTASKEGFQDESETIKVSQLDNYASDLKIQLNSIYEDFLILVLDETKNVIPDVDVRVFDKNKKELAINFEKSTGEWIVKLVKSENYTFKAAVKDYQVKEGQLDLSKGKLIPIVLSKDLKEIKIITLDKFTKMPVQSVISYKSSSTNQNQSATPEHKISLKPDEEIKPVFTAKGYKQLEAEAISNQPETTVFMVAESYPIQLLVVDGNGKKIEPDYISVINKETSAPATIQKDYSVMLDAASNYYIDVKKVGYVNHNSPFLPAEAITEGDSKKTITLSKKEFVSQKFKVVNAQTQELVPTLIIKALSREGNQLSVSEEANVWSAQVKNGEPFTLKITSGGYEELTVNYEAITGTTEVLKLSKTKTTELIFEAFDEILKRNVAAKFTLLDDEKTTDLQLFDSGIHAKANLIEGKKYTIRVSAADYQDKEEAFEYTSFTGNPKTINFKRKTYPVKIVLKTAGTNNIIKSPSLKVTSGLKTINTPYVFDKKTFNADLSTDETYDLTLNVEGFRSISDKLIVSDLAAANLVKEYTLEEIVVEKPLVAVKPEIIEEPAKVISLPEPVVVIPVAEPIKEELVVVEKTAPKVAETEIKVVEKAAVKIADVYTKNSENLAKIPENTNDMLSELSKKEAVGKRYILTKIYFEQSSPKMRPESDEQLNSILQVLQSNPNLKIELVGHTDNVGDSRQNAYLSNFRAKVVGNFLFNKGIKDSRISVKGMGEKFPVAENNTEENKAQNRRVELIVVEN